MSSSFLRKILMVAVVVIVVIVGYTLAAVNKVNNNPLPPTPQIQTKTARVESLGYNCQKGKTAFDLLKANTTDLDYSQSSFGKLITRINNVSQGNNKYWMYFVDDKEATISADAYFCQASEQIKWELK